MRFLTAAFGWGAIGPFGRPLRVVMVALLAVARMLAPYDTRTLYYKRTPLSSHQERHFNVEYAAMDDVLRQSDVLLKVVDATGQIATLEESLDRNLTAVQKSHNFEEMAINLSAAIQLLGEHWDRAGSFPAG